MPRAGFILTGGRSSRMGRDKALLPWKGRTFAEHLADIASQVVDSVCLVGEPERYSHLPLKKVADIRPGTGPLGGVETALTITHADYNLILACDLPDIPVELLIELMNAAESGDWDCVATRDVGGDLHPLCAVYHRRCLPSIRAALDRREYRLLNVVESIKVNWHEAGHVLPNVNTPEEWHAIQRP